MRKLAGCSRGSVLMFIKYILSSRQPSLLNSCWAGKAAVTEGKQVHGNTALGFREAKQQSLCCAAPWPVQQAWGHSPSPWCCSPMPGALRGKHRASGQQGAPYQAEMWQEKWQHVA